MDAVSKAQQEPRANKPQKRVPPPVETRWKPGQSGNPSGRPKKKPITEIFQELLESAVDREAVKKQVRQTLTNRGMAGVLLLREAAERIEGKVTQTLDVALTDLSDEEIEARIQRLQSKE